MLRKFRVSNFICFQNDFEFNLSETNGYSFNSQCVKNGIVNAALIYGHNGMGKSNLGLAIFDIIEHLTDQRRDEHRYRNYVNAYSTASTVNFYYEFLIDNKIVKYSYKKSDYKILVYEEFSIDDTVLVLFDRTNGNTNFSVGFKGAETLKTIINDSQLSVLKYIKNNTVLEENEQNNIFKAFFSFIERMFFFRSLEDRTYMGLKDTGKRSLMEDIIEWGNVDDFELFLNRANINCKLSVIESLDRKDLAFDFNGKKLLMAEIMSTGTSALTLFYCWYQRIRKKEVSFLFIDEFDAFLSS